MKWKKSDPEKLSQSTSNRTSAIYKVIPTQNFLKEAQLLEKKYPNIRKDFLALASRLKMDPFTGNYHVYKDIWKVRLRIADKKKGESGAVRVIIEVLVVNKEIYVLSAYDKGKIEALTDRELKRLLDQQKPTPKTRGS